MNTEYNPLDPALEQAMIEIRDDSVDAKVIEAAAAACGPPSPPTAMPRYTPAPISRR